MRKIIIFILIISSFVAKAQTDIPLSHYNYNPVILNPATVGFQENFGVYFSFRDQWAGIKGAPESYMFGVHGLLAQNLGVGLNVNKFSNGVFERNLVNLNSSYTVKLGDESLVRFGAAIGMKQNSINPGNDDIGQLDPAVYSNKFKENFFQLAFGMSYENKNFILDLAIPEMFTLNDNNLLKSAYIFTAYSIHSSDKIWRFQPYAGFRNVLLMFSQYEGGLTLEWNKTLRFGGGYRSNQDILATAGVSFKNVTISYTYEINNSPISAISSGTSELTIMYKTPYYLNKRRGKSKATSQNRW